MSEGELERKCQGKKVEGNNQELGKKRKSRKENNNFQIIRRQGDKVPN